MCCIAKIVSFKINNYGYCNNALLGKDQILVGFDYYGYIDDPLRIVVMVSTGIGIRGVISVVRVALILFGIVQLIVSGNVKQKVRGWGWWLAGGIIDILIGFILVGNLSFSEAVLPFFFAFIFMYKGIANLFSALNMVSTHRYWWLYLVNGLLLLILGLLFFASPFTAAFSIIFLCAAAFIYWGFSLIFFGYSLRPVEQ